MSRWLEIDCADAAATAHVGAQLAAVLLPGSVLYLRGELGAGKTTLARALIQTIAPGTRVKSPTYALVEPYVFDTISLYHLDLYRIAEPQELDALDVREMPASGAVLLIEWPERGGDSLPHADMDIHLSYAEPGRRIRLTAMSQVGADLLSRLETQQTGGRLA